MVHTSFVALYRGKGIAGAKLLALSADPQIVADFTDRLLDQKGKSSEDAIVQEIESGRDKALRLVRDNARS